MGIPLGAYWRLLSRYLLSQRGAAVTMAVLLLVSTGIGLAQPQLVRAFIDSAMAGAPVSLLLRAGITSLLLRIGREAVGLLAGYRVQHVAWTACNALRADLVAHLIRLDPDFHKAHPPGELIERIDGDVMALGVFLSNLVVDLIGGVLMLVGILVAVALESVALGGLFLVYAAVSLAVLTWIQRFGPPHWRADRERAARFWGAVGELLVAREDLQTNGATTYGLQRFLSDLHRWRPIRLRAAFWGSIWLVTAVIDHLGIGLSWSVGGPMVLAGSLSLGTLYMIGYYGQMLVWGPIQDIQWQLEGLQRAGVSIKRIQDLLDIRSRLVEGSMTLPDGPLPVTFRSVWFRYHDGPMGEDKQETREQESGSARKPYGGEAREGSVGEASRGWVLRDVSFGVGAGRVLGLLGRTGSGKTTIARLLFRWYDPDQGEVRLGGVDLRQAKSEAVRSRVGLVTQDVQLLDASLRANLTFHDSSVSDEVLVAAVNALGLTGWLAGLPGGLDAPISAATLSAGEAQLVALARAFLTDPDLVILDEASSRLDPATERLLGRALDKLLTGRTAVIIAHRLRTVARADDIVILDEGRVLEAGPRQALAADPQSHYTRLLHTGICGVLT